MVDAAKRTRANALTTRVRAALVALALGALEAGCPPPPNAEVCVAGASVACACASGRTGAQRCEPSGTALGPCVCEGDDAGVEPDAVTPGEDAVAPSEDAVTPSEDAVTPSEDARPVDPPNARTLVFSSLTIDPSSASARAGFDLDGLFSTGAAEGDCGAADAFSATDRDQHCALPTLLGDRRCMGPTGCAPGAPLCAGGVDNRLPELADTIRGGSGIDVRAELARGLATHRLVLLVRITELDGPLGPTLDDRSVFLKFYVGYPAFSTGCDGVRGGRRYRVASSSLVPGAASIEQALLVVPAQIIAGRLRVIVPPEQPVPLALGALFVGRDLATTRFQMRFSLTAAGEGRDGNAGGLWRGQDVYDALAAATMNPGLAGVLVGGLCDVRLEGVCAEPRATPPRFGGIGIGYGFSLVPAELDPVRPIAAGVEPGTCGAAP